MKQYKIPEIKISIFIVENIITTSSNNIKELKTLMETEGYAVSASDISAMKFE